MGQLQQLAGYGGLSLAAQQQQAALNQQLSQQQHIELQRLKIEQQQLMWSSNSKARKDLSEIEGNHNRRQSKMSHSAKDLLVALAKDLDRLGYRAKPLPPPEPELTTKQKQARTAAHLANIRKLRRIGRRNTRPVMKVWLMSKLSGDNPFRVYWEMLQNNS